MIKNSFIVLEKIRAKKEQKIWQQGIYDWVDFLRTKQIPGIPKEKKYFYDRQLWEALKELQAENSAYFRRKFPATESWRLYGYFREETAFLDVEIDSQGKIIVVGISNYYHTNSFVQGVNLEKAVLELELQKYKVLITFNGSSFDLPRLKKQFGIQLAIPHIDLRPLCTSLGLKGGLKEVEQQLKLKRPPNLYGNPVELWKTFHASGDREWLELLLAYNREDIENLKIIMDFVYAQKAKEVKKYINSTSFTPTHERKHNALGSERGSGL